MPAPPRRAVKIGFSLVRSPENVRVEVQSVLKKEGSTRLAEPRWSSRPAKPASDNVSARPRKFLRVYSIEPSGPQNVCWLVENFVDNPTGGRPGKAMVPLGMLPPRLMT